MKNLNEIGELLVGGLADSLEIKDIADKFGLDEDFIKNEVEQGIKVEMEHVGDEEYAFEIAKDHLIEIPDYYTRLAEMELEAKEYWKNGNKN